MRPAEETYIAVVVIRRPVHAGAADPDPSELAQSVLDSLTSAGRGPRYGPHRYQPPVPPPQTTPYVPRRKWGLLALAIACWAAAGLSFLMLWK